MCIDLLGASGRFVPGKGGRCSGQSDGRTRFRSRPTKAIIAGRRRAVEGPILPRTRSSDRVVSAQGRPATQPKPCGSQNPLARRQHIPPSASQVVAAERLLAWRDQGPLINFRLGQRPSHSPSLSRLFIRHTRPAVAPHIGAKALRHVACFGRRVRLRAANREVASASRFS